MSRMVPSASAEMDHVGFRPKMSGGVVLGMRVKLRVLVDHLAPDADEAGSAHLDVG